MLKIKLKLYKILTVFLSVVILVTAGFLIVSASDLSPSTAPANYAMHTLEEIYCRIKGCTATLYGLNPSGTPSSTMYTIKEVYDVLPDFKAQASPANATDVWSGKFFYSGSGALLTGTLKLASNISTFDGTVNRVPDFYDGGGNGTNRWMMTNSGDVTVNTDSTSPDVACGKTAWVDGVFITGSASCGFCQTCIGGACVWGDTGDCGACNKCLNGGCTIDDTVGGCTICNTCQVGSCKPADTNNCGDCKVCSNGNCVNQETNTCPKCQKCSNGACAPFDTANCGACKTCSNGSCVVSDAAGGCPTCQKCSGGICIAASNALGCACTDPPGCESGYYCIEGVCCNTTCTGLCQSCLAVKKHQGTDGTCGYIASGWDPDNECPATGCGGAQYNSATGLTCSEFCSNQGTTGNCSGGGSCSKCRCTDMGLVSGTGGKYYTYSGGCAYLTGTCDTSMTFTNTFKCGVAGCLNGVACTMCTCN